MKANELSLDELIGEALKPPDLPRWLNHPTVRAWIDDFATPALRTLAETLAAVRLERDGLRIANERHKEILVQLNTDAQQLVRRDELRKDYRATLNRICDVVGHPPISPDEGSTASIAERVESLSRDHYRLSEHEEATRVHPMAACAASLEHHEEHHQRERELEAKLEEAEGTIGDLNDVADKLRAALHQNVDEAGAELARLETERDEAQTARDLMTAELGKAETQVDRLRTELDDSADAVDALRRIGYLVGCEHTRSRDDRARLVRCVREAIETARHEAETEAEQARQLGIEFHEFATIVADAVGFDRPEDFTVKSLSAITAKVAVIVAERAQFESGRDHLRELLADLAKANVQMGERLVEAECELLNLRNGDSA